MILRDYQQRAIDELYAWFGKNSTGNPCLVLPTGSGKSHIVAALCKDAVQNWPDTKVLMLTHVKELIEQNAEKMRQHWKGAPMGIYSASIGRRDLGEPITFAGIQSIAKKADQVGHIDLVIVDECHLISHRQDGSYRTFLADLKQINPNVRVIGLTATPWRLGHGYITDGDGLFDALIEPVTIEELLRKGHLCMLRSKVTDLKISTDGVKKRGGEYIEKDLQAAANTLDNNQAVVSEVIRLGADRKSWLFFCTGVDHAQDIRDEIRSRGITAECVTGETPKKERARILDDFKAGRIQALTNANVLTTGFDAPSIDLIAMLRATLSPTLYVQMVGRGFRVSPTKDDCLILDFAGVVETHGPVTNITPPEKGSDEPGEAPSKVCDQCNEIVHAAAKICPSCGFEFPPPEANKSLVLRNDDIMGLSGKTMHVSEWNWREHTSGASGKTMLAVTYYGDLSDAPVTEYHCILHQGFAGQKAVRQFTEIAHFACADIQVKNDGNMLKQLSGIMNRAVKPTTIEYIKDGKFHRVVDRSWSNSNE